MSVQSGKKQIVKKKKRTKESPGIAGAFAFVSFFDLNGKYLQNICVIHKSVLYL